MESRWLKKRSEVVDRNNKRLRIMYCTYNNKSDINCGYIFEKYYLLKKQMAWLCFLKNIPFRVRIVNKSSELH